MDRLITNLPEYVLNQILENAFQWFVVVDQDARILYMNQDYCKFLHIEQKDTIGRPVNEVIENTRMHEVVKTGEEHIASPHYIKGTYMLANRIPIRVDNKVVGAFGSVVFRDLHDWHHLSSHVKQTLEKINMGAPAMEESTYQMTDIKGSSAAILSIKDTIHMIAPSDLPVLIQGESGTGKTLFAHSIHQLSNRSDHPLITVNCAAIPPNLLETELFGKGDRSGRKGRIQLADKGTLFLDDIGSLPLPVQVKLLRLLNDGVVESPNSHQVESVNVRVIASSSQPLTELIEANQFRTDLYYRIQAITLNVPPLRERMEDFAEIISFIFHKTIGQTGKRSMEFSKETFTYLNTYHWPGNIRELQNVIQAAVYLTSGDVITPDALPPQVKQRKVQYAPSSRTLAESLEEVERTILLDTLAQFPNKKEAALILGISKTTFYEKLKKYDI
ncbi:MULTISPECIES: sigma-54-dependent Fis family transcriptional regulator [Sporosarcina]|uniref:sigma-54 interaction domain-containing protein n=1 Tax=Sporosarcina TaxID=1569 RepID=UPI000A17CC42|nr:MULTISPECIES: sigma 54-interacting transcriptional regulator [Sporosarcina]ARK22493.1 sigma-54-dependent Fis family transcriptional regulator [Sporosarcina ureae]PIC72999.1 sigma-54-dependent Fis family transcriptional regulator [Sporosarcina sp. P17b]